MPTRECVWRVQVSGRGERVALARYAYMSAPCVSQRVERRRHSTKPVREWWWCARCLQVELARIERGSGAAGICVCGLYLYVWLC